MTDTHAAAPDATANTPGFSADLWAAWWAAPDLTRRLEGTLSPDIVGYWPGDSQPVRGLELYVAKIEELLTAVPDLRLELVDSATVAGAVAGEQLVFLHYIGTGTGPDGPFAIRGLDRVRTRAGIVVENVIRYDPSEFPAS